MRLGSWIRQTAILRGPIDLGWNLSFSVVITTVHTAASAHRARLPDDADRDLAPGQMIVPPTCSLVSANGPSVNLVFSCANGSWGDGRLLPACGKVPAVLERTLDPRDIVTHDCGSFGLRNARPVVLIEIAYDQHAQPIQMEPSYAKLVACPMGLPLQSKRIGLHKKLIAAGVGDIVVPR